jgi:hypothetical protein
MQKEYNVLDREFDHKEEFYYCCCQGYEMGYYSSLRNNKNCQDICLIGEEKDRHSLGYKYQYIKKAEGQDGQLEIYDGKLQGDVGKNLWDALEFKEDYSLIGNAGVMVNLLEIFNDQKTAKTTIVNLHGSKRTGRKTIATHFGHLTVIKQLFSRLEVRLNVTVESICEVLKKELSKKELDKKEEVPLFIFAFN